MPRKNEYDLTAAFQKIEDELIASMIRNMDRHRAEETKEGYNWSMWRHRGVTLPWASSRPALHKRYGRR